MTIQRYIELQRWDGTRLVLHQSGRAAPYKVLKGATGLDAPPMHYTWESAPGIPGDRLAGLAIGGRTLFLPVAVRPRGATMNRRLADLTSFIATQYPMSLRIVTPTSDRTLSGVYYEQGLEGDEGRDSSGEAFTRFGLRLRATQPYWADTLSSTVRFQLNQQRPFFPVQVGADALRLNANATFGTYEYQYYGDVPAPINVAALGPGTGLTITDEDGRRFTYTGDIPTWSSGYWFYLDPANPSSLLGWEQVTMDSQFPMAGTTRYGTRASSDQMSSFGVTMSGASPTSVVTIAYKPRWNSWRPR